MLALFLNYVQISPKNAKENHNSQRNVAYLLLPGASFMCKYSNMVFKKTKLDIQYTTHSVQLHLLEELLFILKSTVDLIL